MTGVQFSSALVLITICSARKYSTGARLLVELNGITSFGGAQGASVTTTITSSKVGISVTLFFAVTDTLKIPNRLGMKQLLLCFLNIIPTRKYMLRVVVMSKLQILDHTLHLVANPHNMFCRQNF